MENSGGRSTVLMVSMLGAFLTPFMASSVNIAIPSIGKEFNMNAVLLSWVAISYLLSAAIFLVPFGRLADIYGRKRIFLYGILGFSITSAMCGFSAFPAELIIFRTFQGIGSAMIFGTGIAILTSVYKPEERGKVLGLNVAVTYLGLSMGPVLGGFLTHYLGWRSIFMIIVPFGGVAAFFTAAKLKYEWREAEDEKFDFAGSIIYGVALSAIMYGFSLLPQIPGFILVAAGVAGITGFGAFESRKENPVLQVNIFKSNRTFVYSSIAALINYSATYAVSFLLSLYLQYIKGFTPQIAGLVLISQPVVQALLSPFAGILSDKTEVRKIATAGMAATTLSLIIFVLINNKTSLMFVLINLAVLGAGLALFTSPNTNAIMGSVERKYYGVASGIVGTMRLVGQMLSMGIVTLIFAIHMGSSKITPYMYPVFLQSVKIVFGILAFLCLAGTLASYARGCSAPE